METFFNDLKFGLRNIQSKPIYSIIALLTLALGIGVTSAMYTLVDKVLLQPLPFPKSEQLVLVSTVNKKANRENNATNIDTYEQMRDANSPLSSLVFWAFDQVTLAKGEQQIPLTLLLTSDNYMPTYGIQPQLGRWYNAEDIDTQSVLVSHDLWIDEFNSDPSIVGRQIKLNKQDYTILGVMPDGFAGSGYSSPALWMPINKLDRPVTLGGRLKPGITIEQAQLQSTTLQSIVNSVSGDSENIWEIKYISLLDRIVGDSRPALYLLLASVIAVFLIAVLNVVNLTFAQYTNRTQELAVRVSVGATRSRLLRQLMSESLLLCTLGGALGLLLAAWSLEWIQAFMGSRLPRVEEIGIDLNTLLTILLLISISAAATALIPAFTLVNPNKLANAIKQAGRKSTGDKQSQKIRRALVAGEICVAVILLISAGLFLRSYATLANQAPGFTSTNVVTGHIWLADNFNPQPNRAGYWLRVVEALKSQANVVKVAATSTMPMSRTGIDFPTSYTFPGAPAVPRGEEPSASLRTITPAYFDLLEIPIIDGREFNDTDTADSPKVVIINEHLAKRNWPYESPVGNTLTLPDWLGGDHRIVGVVGNVKHKGLRANITSEFFLPVTQRTYPGMSFLVKTVVDNEAETKNMMLKTSIELEPTAPMIQLENLHELTETSIMGERIILTILTVFAGLALVLASIGVFGMSDNMVSQRTNEIGIRMAIGAKPSTIKNWIIWDTTKPILYGAGIGIILAFIFSHYFASILYGVKPWDPLTFISIPLILLVVGFVATWLPARNATKIHPQHALQYE